MTRKVFPLVPDSPPPLLCPDLLPVSLEHRNPWFKVLSRGSYYTLEYDRPQVVILPVLDREAIVMTRVRRPLIGDSPLELPAGDSEPGETPRMAAMRELREETGVGVEDPERFMSDLPICEMPGRMPFLLSVFRVDLTRREFDSRSPHDGEIVSVEAVSFSDAARRLIDGEIYLSAPSAIVSRLILREWLRGRVARREAE